MTPLKRMTKAQLIEEVERLQHALHVSNERRAEHFIAALRARAALQRELNKSHV